MAGDERKHRKGHNTKGRKEINQTSEWGDLFSGLETTLPSLNIMEYPPVPDPFTKKTKKDSKDVKEKNKLSTHGIDNGLWPPGRAPASTGASEMFDSLSVFEETREEPLIDLFASSSETTTYTRGIPIRDGDKACVNSSQSGTGPAQNLRSERSLLDIDDSSDALENERASQEDEVCFCRKRASEAKHYFCYPCNCVFCSSCWGKSPPHRNANVRGGIPHEKTDPGLARIIEQTLEAEMDDKAQTFSLMKDEDSAWFGTIWDESDLIFQDYGRYAHIMADISDQKRQTRYRYPGLVSFVGQTGAGKSTLVKLLIELGSTTNKDAQVPVVGSVKNQDLPTSGDVHLYSDPDSAKTDTPILYADCEGLDGGEREPMGVRSKRMRKKLPANRIPEEVRIRQNASDRYLLWATSEKTQSREYIVRNLYPRLLYTFSDTIVFVTKNPRVIENVIDQLIEWAAAALEKSSNQPVLPHAIILLNATENTTDPRLWDVDASTEHLMESAKEAIERNHNLRTRAAFWAPKHRRIRSVKDLLLSYYSTIRVVRVPEKGRPNLISEQIGRLYDEIKRSCQKSRQVKGQLRMLLNSDDLEPYLQYAFDHFSRELDMPFDFVQASFTINPIPSDFGGGILRLARDILDVWKDQLDGATIFKELSYLIASCVMLDSVRRRTLGPAESVFREYLEYFDDALDDFCDHHWPCEYRSTEGRCVNVRSGHQAKGHQLKNGRVLAVQDYESSFTAEGFRETFRNMICNNLGALVLKLQQVTGSSTENELNEAAIIHRELVLKNFYRHLGGSSKFISHTACYACLVEPPEHALPCGHILCTPCVRIFGSQLGKNVFEIVACPLHFDEAEGQCPQGWVVSLKPPHAGTRILTLDGGGIRGIVELMLLQQIEKTLGYGLYIQDFFDLIVGTSTGGIIALGLGASGYSVNDCISSFRALCHKAFTKRKGIGIPVVEQLVRASNHSKFETKPIEEALQKFYGEDYLFGGARQSLSSTSLRRITKVAVISTTTTASVTVLANYNRRNPVEYSSYRFYRSEKPESEMTIWQAARATSAAPRFFKPFFHGPSGQSYQDGAIYYNNPVEIAIGEQRLIWPQETETYPDIVLSVGTGYSSTVENLEVSQLPKPPTWGPLSHVKSLAKIAMDHIQNSLDCEKTWKSFLEKDVHAHKFSDRYIRANLPVDGDLPVLDEVQALDKLSEMARFRFTKQQELIQAVADRLVASSFYFEPLLPPNTTDNGDGSFTLKGNILCRFPPGSEQIQYLGENLRLRAKTMFNSGNDDHQPYFAIHEKRRERDRRIYVIEHSTISAMIHRRPFSLGKIDIRLSGQMAETEIYLCLDGDRTTPTKYPISGFPRCLLEDELPTSAKTRFFPLRTRSRSSYQNRSRTPWRKASTEEDIYTTNPIDRFTAESYVLPKERVPHLGAASSLLQRMFGREDGPPATSVSFGTVSMSTGEAEITTEPVYELYNESMPPVELPTPYNNLPLPSPRRSAEIGSRSGSVSSEAHMSR
ncbi:hypothetical protein FE257_002086 [Aspergillus nanangensis]|uniref:PNPLA domain-containing protein n=1 Tax=Aspergillus nanangensis TaxID=2582783 RepID=A0AAD4CTB7_ASPNN|nr:hypothetical protein FE257_002086 [Aspergillus nanangensis]